MSEQAPDKNAYVYQPDPPSRGDRIYAIGGLPLRFTKDEAEAVAATLNEMVWMADRCVYCGHIFALESTSCAQCDRDVPAPWRDVKTTNPCDCRRCSEALRDRTQTS